PGLARLGTLEGRQQRPPVVGDVDAHVGELHRLDLLHSHEVVLDALEHLAHCRDLSKRWSTRAREQSGPASACKRQSTEPSVPATPAGSTLARAVWTFVAGASGS